MIIIGGQIESLSTRRDKTIKLTIGTQELSPAQSSDIFQLNQQFAFIGLKSEPFQKTEEDLINGLKIDYENIKSPSQRLRGILYKNFEQDPEGYKDFNSYYIAKMELICNHYKNKLEATY